MSAALTTAPFASIRSMATSYGSNMRKSGGPTTKVGGIDTHLCVLEWRRRSPTKTANDLSARYGCPVRTAENWLSGSSRPDGHWTSVIFQVELPEFLIRIMPNPPRYLQEAAVQMQIRREEESIARAQAALAELQAVSA